MIADIYCRVSTGGQAKGGGLARQEFACRAWCAQHGHEVRNVIQSSMSAFHRDFLRRGPLFEAIESWRKGYWQGTAEPLTEEDCDPKVVAVDPPDLLVVEEFDRFSRLPPFDTLFVLKFLKGIGIRLAVADDDQIIEEFRLPTNQRNPRPPR